MIPAKYNMVCPQGSTFQKTLTYIINDVPVDLTSYTARMQIREKHSSTAVIVQIDSLIGGIALGAGGTIDLVIQSAVTEDFIAKEYVYDIEIISSTGVVTRIIEGKFIVTPEVTRV